MRTRHWKQLSEIVGYDLTPDSGTTMRKVLKLNLTPYLEKFEVISAGASKVNMKINWNTLFDEFVNQIIIVFVVVECIVLASSGRRWGKVVEDHSYFSPQSVCFSMISLSRIQSRNGSFDLLLILPHSDMHGWYASLDI